jgi:hypothetical protein
VPDAPTITSATAGTASADIAFTAPGSNGGSTITDYEVKIDNGVFFLETSLETPQAEPVFLDIITSDYYKFYINKKANDNQQLDCEGGFCTMGDKPSPASHI